VLRLPTWAGLIALAAAAVGLARKAAVSLAPADRALVESRA
jgi:hypothetical protein